MATLATCCLIWTVASHKMGKMRCLPSAKLVNSILFDIMIKKMLGSVVDKITGMLSRIFGGRARTFTLATLAIILVILLVGYSYTHKKAVKTNLIEQKVDSLLSWKKGNHTGSNMAYYQRIETAKALLAEQVNPTLLGKIFIREATLELDSNRFKAAIRCYQQAINEFGKVNDKPNLANTYYKLGDAYKKIGEYNLGFKSTVKGLDLYIEQNDFHGQRRCYNNIGSFYKYLEEYGKALVYYQKALAISQRLSYNRGISSALNNIGTIYSSLNKNELALEFYHKSYSIKEQKGSLSSAIYYSNVAGVLLKLGKYREALASLNRAKHYHSLQFEPRNLISNYLTFGDYYEKTARIDSALHYYSKALALAKQYNFKERLLSCYQNLSQGYSIAGNYQKAFESQAEFINLHRKMLDRQKSLEIAHLEMDFEARNMQLSRDSAKIKTILLLIIFTLIVISFVLTVLHIRSKHKNIVHHLEEEKSKVETDLNEKNRELTLYSLQMIQHQETSKTLIEKLQTRFTGCSSDIRKELQPIMQELERESSPKQLWEEFERRFIGVNPTFYTTLLSTYSDLTQNEKRLCAFLKLNMSTKEISIITGQSPHSINVARTRLRKKIGLSNCEVNISDFLSNI